MVLQCSFHKSSSKPIILARLNYRLSVGDTYIIIVKYDYILKTMPLTVNE